MSKIDELVLCKYTENKYFIPNNKLIYSSENYSWQRRGDCETNPRYKQLIPYIIYYDLAQDMYAAYYRKSGDGRLIGSLSIGIGGHINPCDCKTTNIHIPPIVINNINRELSEELPPADVPQYDWWSYFRGFIYDDSDAVGRVHVGLVFLKHTTFTDAWTFEDDEHIFHPLKYEDLRKNYENLENWSKAIYDVAINKGSSNIYFRSTDGI